MKRTHAQGGAEADGAKGEGGAERQHRLAGVWISSSRHQSIGSRLAMISARRGSRNGGSTRCSPSAGTSSFGAMPNGTPLIHCGTTMPSGGCNAETGKVYLSENN